jgi:hypothetical protein
MNLSFCYNLPNNGGYMTQVNYAQMMSAVSVRYEGFMQKDESWVHTKLGRDEASKLPPQWVRSNINTLVSSLAMSCATSVLQAEGSRFSAGLQGGFYGVVATVVYALATRASWISKQAGNETSQLPGDLLGLAFSATAAVARFAGSKVDIMSFLATLPSYIAQRKNCTTPPAFVFCVKG